jgi:glutathione S-transferase
MKLYMHPVSMTSRPVRLFIAENGIQVEEQVVDLMQGEHLQATFAAVNPSKMVPVLEDGDLRLSESSAILKYLADKIESPAYPKDLKKRAKVNEAMDWFNTNFYRDFGYGLTYPQLFPHHKRQTDDAHRLTIEWGQQKSQQWFKILNDDIIGKRNYVCGDTITIADYFGVCLVTAGELTRCDYSKYPNVNRWIGTMKQLKSWAKVSEVVYGFAGSLKGQSFVTI